MSSEWRTGKLLDFCELKRGYDLPQAKRIQGSFPLVSSSGISGVHNMAMVKGPGVVTGRYGTIGQVFYIEDDFWPLNTTLYVRDFKGNHPNFIHYFLKTLDFSVYSDKAAVPGVNRNHLHEANVALPEFADQERIAGFLHNLDNRITLLRETNATLEAIAQSLFKSWFVDFDPVRAKMEGRAPEGMDEATAALFPDGFNESSMPIEWSSGRVADLMTLHRGSVNPSAKPDEMFQHFSLPAFDDGAMPVFELGAEIKSNKTSVPVDAILISKLNPRFPRIWLPSDVQAKAICSTEFLPMLPTEISTQTFNYCLANSHAFTEKLKQLVTGTSSSHQRIKPESALALNAIVPPRNVVVAFDAIVSPMLMSVRNNRRSIQVLTDLRDTLLPRLISGRLHLPEAQTLAEEALT